jgi:adenosylcobinamide-phosphate guanylyltransferase
VRVPALIMAGGKGSRMGLLPTEKPLLKLRGKPLIDWVAEAVASAKHVSEFYVVTSPNTPHTEKHCKDKGWQIIHTDAKGYHCDLKQATRQANLTGAVLTVPADSPALTGKFLDQVIEQFEQSGKDFYAVFVPIAAREKLGLSIDSMDEYKGEWHAVSGINIVDGAKIQGEGKIETAGTVISKTEAMLNVNTVKDLEIAEKIMRKR